MLDIIILAGGLGKRMNSDIPKVLHEIGGIPMLVRIIIEAIKLEPKKIFIVVGKYRKNIEEVLNKYFNLDNIVFVNQEPALGTGHAIQCCIEYLTTRKTNKILILSGDVPLIKVEIMKYLFEEDGNKLGVKMMTTILDEPYGNGRIVRNNNYEFIKIIEEKDCSEIEKNIKEVNCGIYLFDRELLCKYLYLLDNKNAQKEYYLTDMIKIIKDIANERVDIYILPKEEQWQLTNINSKEDKEKVNNMFI